MYVAAGLPHSRPTVAGWVPAIVERHQEEILARLAGKCIYVICDVTTDDRTRKILNVLFAVPVKSSADSVRPFIVDMMVLESTTAATVGGAIMRSLALVGVAYADVLGLVSDGAMYMKACWRDTIKPVCTNSVHVVCIAHCLYLVGEKVCTDAPQV